MNAHRSGLWGVAWVFLVALVLRLHGLGAESLWFDEAITYGRALLPLPELVADTVSRKHVPTYFVFMHSWVKLGDSEAFLRLPSALFGALTAGLLTLAGRRLAGTIAGFAAGLCAAFGSALVYYGQEARMYTVLTFEAALGLYAYAVLFTETERAYGASRSTRMAYIALGASSASLLYTHNTGMFCVAGFGALGMALVLGSNGQRIAVARAWASSQGVALLLWIPWIPNLVRQAGTFDKWRNPPLSWDHGRRMVEQLLALDREVGPALAVLLVVMVTLALFQSPRRALCWGLLATVVLGVAVTTTASLLKANMLFVRTLLWCLLPLYVLVGCGVAALRRPLLQGAVLCALVSLHLPALVTQYRTPTKTPWRELIKALVHETTAETPVLSVRGTRFTTYYFERSDSPVDARPVREWEPTLALAANLPPGTRRFGVVVWRGSGRARSFFRALQRSPFRPIHAWTRGAAYVAIYAR